MWMFRVFSSGYYSIFLWPVHIPLWCTGYLVQDKLKPMKSRRIWLAILTAGLILGEMLCEWVLTGYDRLGAYLVFIIVWDLLMGYFAKPVYHLLRKPLRAMIDWINREEETDQSEQGGFRDV